MLRGGKRSGDGTTGIAESTKRAAEIPLSIKLARTWTLYSFSHFREATTCLGRGQV